MIIDPFLLSHRQAVLVGGSRQAIPNSVFATAARLASARLPVPDTSVLAGSQSVSDHMALYGLWARQQMRCHVRPTPTHDGSDRAGQQFLMSIMLHQLLQHMPATSRQERVGRRAVGTMLQRELTLLLCEVDLEQIRRVMNFRKTLGDNHNEWGINVAGAGAAACVLLTLTARSQSHVFLPTGHEDANLGIDLFWEERGASIAVSVKCVAGADSKVFTWRLDEEHRGPSIVSIGSDAFEPDKLRIQEGAQRFSNQCGKPWIPVLVCVTRPLNLLRAMEENGTQTYLWPEHILMSNRKFAR